MKYVFLTLLIACALHSSSQNKSPYEYKKAITFNPFALAQPDYTFLPGIEYKLLPNLALMGEAGYIFGTNAGSTSGNQKAGGFIIRPGIRFYVNAKNNFYLQPQMFLKQVTQKMYDWLGKDCVNGVPAYEELEHFKLRRTVYGINFTAGKVASIFKGAALLDFYFGIGIRHRNRKLVGDDRDCYNEPSNGINFFAEDGVLPSLPLGIRICVPFGQQ